MSRKIRREMTKSRTMTQVWARRHRGKRVYATWAEANVEVRRLEAQRLRWHGRAVEREPYVCRFSDEPDSNEVHAEHWHIGRPQEAAR
jgi:hypothetical protein